ncbi:MAG: rRNA adenine N-6-methyltransferase family protein [Holosporaceae bacterium]|jgi:ubiquinone/menaquinone biosynthesis C-methylase UbiE|nr:rRNA adenine N-6-methyltransferase family protein [Holosporaceae bacterium]
MKKKISDGYLHYIDDPLNGGADKLELLKYLRQTDEGMTVLEVGPGAGSALASAIEISQTKNYPDKYFAVDIDSSILEKLKKHPIISKYSNIHYLHQDILKMSYPNNFFDIINLSSVAHECASYQGGWRAIELLAESVIRLIKRRGILLIRELECRNFYTIAKCELLGIPLKAFFRVFLKKFMDREYCDFSKPSYYDIKSIRLYLQEKEYSLRDFFSHCQYSVTSDSVMLQAPIGLIKEVQRHFLTFLNVFSPECFYCVQEGDDQYVSLRFDKNNALCDFILCCQHINVDYRHIGNNLLRIERKNLSLIEAYIEKKFLRLVKPYHITVPQKHARRLKNFLDKSKFLFSEDEDNFTLFLEDILLLDNVLTDMSYKSDVEQHVLDWSRREGDEHYYFENSQKLIELFIKKSLLHGANKSHTYSDYGDCLVPIETSFVPRHQYIDILKLSFKEYGKECCYTELEGKRIVHFQMLPLQTAAHKIINFFDRHYGGVDHILRKQLIDYNVPITS